jgi:ABC-type nickel/cobalt efflux system permease component RcnA
MDNFQLPLTMAGALAAAYSLLMLVFLRLPDRMADQRETVAPVLQKASWLLLIGIAACFFLMVYEATEFSLKLVNPFEIYFQLVTITAFGYLLVWFALRVFQIILIALRTPPEPPVSKKVRDRLRDRTCRRV